jgi:hypothetical protein
MSITGSVGKGGRNSQADTRIVQTLLNPHVRKLGVKPLEVDGVCGPLTADAITRYQLRVMKQGRADGRVDPGYATIRSLESSAGGSRAGIMPPGGAPDWLVPDEGGGTLPPAPDPLFLSGAAWWQRNRTSHPESSSLSSLSESFRPKAETFLAALTAAGAKTHLSACFRSRSKGWLMHYSWQVAMGAVAPEDVPYDPEIPNIVWDHGDLARSRSGATEMKNIFHLAFKPKRDGSLHYAGNAIDVTISWTGTIKVKNQAGVEIDVSGPCDGASNTTLHAIGASYGVHKLVGDAPHWSSTGG